MGRSAKGHFASSAVNPVEFWIYKKERNKSCRPLAAAGSLQTGTIVVIIKIAETVAPYARAGSWDNYPPGATHEGVSLPVDYEIVGALISPIRLGRPILVERFVRNGVSALGVFQSTPVVSMVGVRVETRNSVYRIEPL